MEYDEVSHPLEEDEENKPLIEKVRNNSINLLGI